MKLLVRPLPLLILIFGTTSCVSVNLPTTTGKKADGVAATAPAAPFHDMASSADKAWISEKTGNTISYISECGSKADPSLQQLRDESMNALVNAKISDEKTFAYNGREALEATGSGTVDGVAVTLRLVVLKKNGCQYTLSYGGVSKGFEAETSHFKNFVEGFKAP